MDIPIEIVRANLTEEYVKVQQKISDAYDAQSKAAVKFSRIMTAIYNAVHPPNTHMRNGVVRYYGESEWSIALEIEALSKELVIAAGKAVDARHAITSGLLDRGAILKEAK